MIKIELNALLHCENSELEFLVSDESYERKWVKLKVQK